MTLPRWFIQTEDQNLHAYYTLGVLLADLAKNKGEKVTILRLEEEGFTTRFSPVSESELRKECA